MNFLPNRNIFWAEVLLLPAKDSLTQESPSHHKLKKVNNMNLSRHWTTGSTAYNSEKRKIKQVTPTIALTVCPEAVSRLQKSFLQFPCRKGNPKSPVVRLSWGYRDPSPERPEILKFVRRSTGEEETAQRRWGPEAYREVLASLAERWSHTRSGSPHKYQKAIRKQEAKEFLELIWSWEEFTFPPALEKRSWNTQSIRWSPQKNHVSVMGIN